jgi:hypothetical protein
VRDGERYTAAAGAAAGTSAAAGAACVIGEAAGAA